MSICAFTSVCEEDACWVPQYLAEIARLEMPFCVHLDRCSERTSQLFFDSPWFISSTERRRGEFNEQHKQGVLDLVATAGFKWAFAWDIDETYEKDAPAKLKELCKLDVDNVDTVWLNLWDDKDHIRVDPPFDTGHRVKLYNMESGRWTFEHKIVNGAKIVGRKCSLHKSDLVCLHWGMMTLELRKMHKERWDRIYSTALRGDPNPYGFWKHALEAPATVEKHAYF